MRILKSNVENPDLKFIIDSVVEAQRGLNSIIAEKQTLIENRQKSGIVAVSESTKKSKHYIYDREVRMYESKIMDEVIKPLIVKLEVASKNLLRKTDRS